MKIFTTFICLSIVTISLLTGCDTSTEKEEKTPQIENNVEYFKGYSAYGKPKEIIRSSQELQEFLNSDYENYNNFDKITSKYNDDFFADNTLVAVALSTDTRGYELTVTSFEPENEKLKVSIELKKYIYPNSVSLTVIENWLVLIETPQDSIKNCTEIDVTENKLYIEIDDTDCSK